MKNLRQIVFLIILLVFAAGVFVYLTFSGRITSNPVSTALITTTRPYPALTGPKTITLNCNYHGTNLAVNETLYSSLDDYYKNDPTKKIDYYHNDNKDFVYAYAKDNTVDKLTADIRGVATANGLGPDQTLDLAACMLQSIPYDDSKAAKILAPDSYKYPVDQVIPRYPYETLYDFTGICTDKSFLGAMVFEKLGYRTSLLVFDKERHMSIGVGVPTGYGDFGTNYGVMELTGQNFLVGDIPRISASAGLAVNTISTLPNSDTATAPTETALSTPNATISISGGSDYQRIVDRTALKNELTQLRSQLDSLVAGVNSSKASLTAEEQKLATAEATYKANSTRANYNAYLTVYNEYTSVYGDTQAKIGNYNSLVATYNAKVATYRTY